ncbi:MAG: hypothetical protein HYT21_02005 [Candidatus Nealsonbacteria bacterium]|nr:hypothetical protein [Candidatus Nealsonbacteria bacterium]
MLKNLIWPVGALLLVAGIFVYALSSNKVPPPNPAVADEVLPTATATATATPETKTNSIIPMVTVTPVPAKTREYVYNAVEYLIASRSRSFIWLKIMLKERGYNIQDEEIQKFREQHGVDPGDSIVIRGKIVGRSDMANYAGVRIESPEHLLSCMGSRSSTVVGVLPQWASDALQSVKAGKEVVLTLRGTATSESYKITDCQPVIDGK